MLIVIGKYNLCIISAEPLDTSLDIWTFSLELNWSLDYYKTNTISVRLNVFIRWPHREAGFSAVTHSQFLFALTQIWSPNSLSALHELWNKVINDLEFLPKSHHTSTLKGTNCHQDVSECQRQSSSEVMWE